MQKLKSDTFFFRGNKWQDIVISDDEAKLFFDTVGEMAEPFNLTIFCDKKWESTEKVIKLDGLSSLL